MPRRATSTAHVIRRAPVPTTTIIIIPGIANLFRKCGNTQRLTCILSIFPSLPYCGKLSYTQYGEVSYFCTDVPSLTYFAAYEAGITTPSSNIPSTQGFQSSPTPILGNSIGSSGIIVSSSTSPISSSPVPVPFTQSQETAGTTGSQASATSTTTSSNAGKVLLTDVRTGAFVLAAMISMMLL
jgi:hypothetical protein